MNTGIISARYARALLAYAMEQGAEDAVYDSMKSLVRTLHEVKEFPVILRNPGLRPSERVDLICSVMEPLSVIRRFVRLVVKMERVEMLIFIAYEYYPSIVIEKGYTRSGSLLRHRLMTMPGVRLRGSLNVKKQNASRWSMLLMSQSLGASEWRPHRVVLMQVSKGSCVA